LRRVSKVEPRQSCRRKFSSSPRIAPELCKYLVPRNQRAQGRPGAQHAPMARVQQKSTRREPQVWPIIRPSLHNGFNGLYVISPVTMLGCHRRSSDSLSTGDFSACIGAPGPHDFAVRKQATFVSALPRPPHPALNVRDDRDTPLSARRDERSHKSDFSRSRSDLFFAEGLDRNSRTPPVGQITW
jgi:hypothetical protein